MVIKSLLINTMNKKLFVIFIFLAVFQLPIITVGNDSIGLFDLYLPFYLLFLCIRKQGIFVLTVYWKQFFFIFFSYIVYLVLTLISFFDLRSLLVLIKHIEYLLVFLIVIVNIETFRIKTSEIANILKVIFLLLAIFQIISWFDRFINIIPGIEPGFGLGDWYRVGLPFMEGTSSNPAGFLLGAYMYYYIEGSYHQQEGLFYKFAFPFIVFLSLFLTISRTNILAFIIIFSLSYLFKMFSSKIYRTIFMVIATVLFFTISLFFDYLLEQNSHFETIVKLILDPSKILEDDSFMHRFTGLWVNQIDVWLKNAKTILFGNGIANIVIADSTYLGLLANQGIIGLVFFVTLWYIVPFIKRPNVGVFLFLFYVFLNGVTAETLIVSFRSVQVYIIILVLIVYDKKFGKHKYFDSSKKELVNE